MSCQVIVIRCVDSARCQVFVIFCELTIHAHSHIDGAAFRNYVAFSPRTTFGSVVCSKQNKRYRNKLKLKTELVQHITWSKAKEKQQKTLLDICILVLMWNEYFLWLLHKDYLLESVLWYSHQRKHGTGWMTERTHIYALCQRISGIRVIIIEL